MLIGTMRNRRFCRFTGQVVCLVLIWGVFWMPPCLLAAGQTAKEQAIFSHGSGPIEVLIFTDYYSPPCQKLEPYLDTVLPELLPLGVRVSFIDMPFSRKAPMFARFFLYAANAAESLEDILHARRLLLDAAKEDSVESDKDMLQVFKDGNMALQFFDTAPVLSQWAETIRGHNVRNTPTCIVIRPEQEAQRFIGSQKISEAIDGLLDLVIPMAQAVTFHTARGTIFVDARAPEQFVQGHIAGAINIPWEEVYACLGLIFDAVPCFKSENDDLFRLERKIRQLHHGSASRTVHNLVILDSPGIHASAAQNNFALRTMGFNMRSML